MVKPFEEIYRGKTVVVTGHTGFKGSWLSLWLSELGARVVGCSLDPPQDSMYPIVAPSVDKDLRCDIRDAEALADLIRDARPDFVFHLAAQPIVLESYRDPLTTVAVNVLGTAHLLEAVRALDKVCHTVVVTSDKCYLNREWEFAYRECDPLGGKDVYSASKAAAEILVASWEQSFFREAGKGQLATARGGNVIGGGDFASDRIFPDCMRALAAGHSVEVRSPNAVRPWQHVLDCLSGYLRLGEWLASGLASKHDEMRSFNFGPPSEAQRPVRELVEEILTCWPGEWTDVSDPTAPGEAGRLSVSIERSATVLGWKPTWDFTQSVSSTVEWYRENAEGGDLDALRQLMKDQVSRFVKDMKLDAL
jgi:CDP-glucose 4,6-dehydratase